MHVALSLPHDCIQVDSRVEHLGASHAREHQQRVDELAHLHGTLGDDTQVAPPRLVEIGAGRLLQQLGKPANVPQRRAQIVRDGV